MHFVRLFIVGLFLITAYPNNHAQTSNTEAANQLFQQQKWVEAASAYETIVRNDAGNFAAWYQLGMSRMALHEYESAIAAFQKNISIRDNPVAMYNMACAYARLGQKEKAIEWLDKADDKKLPTFIDITGDDDLASLRDEVHFKELATAREKRRRPCLYSPESRQFDFWLGEWEVFNPQGQNAGTSVIQQVAEGCGLLENWTDRFGTTGKSINFYDSAAQKWNQYWIGANGVPSRYSGVYRESAMRYEGEPSVANGVTRLSRLTFFNLDPNTVRQLSEQSVDGGKTWTTVYDLKYVRKKIK